MNKKITFCENCRNDVDYDVSEVMLTGKIKDKEYLYTGKEAHCAECGAPVFVHEISDCNLKTLYDVYRKENNIISLDTVLSIPEKYAIGKRPLSLLLGWGEQTFTRYCDGDMPTRQYSDILIKIWNEPEFYSRLLEENKGKLKSSLAYEKSRKAVDAILNGYDVTEPKIDSIILYLLNQCEDITPLALQKALYYIQGFYYAFYQVFLFPEDCEAWVHGPVYRDIYYRYRDYHFDPIEKPVEFDSNMFLGREIAVIDSVINHICCYSGKVLEHFTHNESPWITSRGDLPASAPSNRIINKQLIGEYFSAVKAKYNMVNPADIKAYSQDMFLQI